MEQKKILLSLMVVGMMGTAALAVAPIGPPVASLAEGQYAVGLGYAMVDLETCFDVGGFGLGAVRKAKQNAEVQAYYGKIGYGISDTWCASVTLGMSGVEADADGIPVGGSDFDGDDKFMYGLTTKKTLHDNGSDTKWGAAFQYMRGRSKDTLSTNTTFGNGTLNIGPATISLDWYLVQLAAGPSIQVNPDVCVYGGPYLMFLDGHLRSNTGPEVELEQNIELGGFIGTMINLGGNAGLNLEFLFSGQSWGAGIGATFPM